MNRLLLTIMFAIALALSFMSIARNDMSWNSNSQNSSTNENGGWVSRMAHLFGSYQPSFGKIVMAQTAPPAAAPTTGPCTQAEIYKTCWEVSSQSDNHLLGYVRVSADPNDKNQNIFKVEVECKTCNENTVYQDAAPKNQKDLKGIAGQLMVKYSEQFKKDKGGIVVAVDKAEAKEQARDQKKLASAEKKAQKAVNTCKITDYEVVDGKVVNGDKVDKDDLTDCLKDHYEQFANSEDKNEKAALKTIKSQLMSQYLNRKGTDDDDDWNTFIEAHSSANDNFGLEMQYRASVQRFANNYGDYPSALNDLKNKNYAGAYQELESLRTKMASDPYMAREYTTDLAALKEVRAKYAETLDDDYKPTAQDYVATSLINSMNTNPTMAAGNLSALETLAKKGAAAQGTPISGDITTQLASIQQSGANATSSLLAWNDSRGADYRGIADGYGALEGFGPSSDPLQLGSTATNTIARTISNANGASTSGVLNANLPTTLRGSRN